VGLGEAPGPALGRAPAAWQPWVLLELEVPRRAVLLSDFERFHAVLNRHYLACSEADDARFGQRLARAGGRQRWPYSPSIRPRVEASWSRIFRFAPRVRDAA